LRILASFFGSILSPFLAASCLSASI
jgi:hypothetical protein